MKGNLPELPQDELMEFMRNSGRALRLLHDGRHEQAIEIYEQLNTIFLFPPNLRFLSEAYTAVGRLEDAIACLEKAVEIESKKTYR